MPELDPPPSADTDAGVRNAYNATRWFRTVIVPETVMCCKYVRWVTAWKAEFEHCSRLVYDIEIVPLEDWPFTVVRPFYVEISQSVIALALAILFLEQ